MARFLNVIHKKAADNARLSTEEEVETAQNIPEEKLRDEDLVSIVHGFAYSMLTDCFLDTHTSTEP
jgi:hypothetical protein